MPFAQRIVQPINLGRQPLEEEYKFDLDIITNRKLVGALRQLGSLIKHGDQIFSGLAQECKDVCERTAKLNKRIVQVGEITKRLNAKACIVRKYTH